jgi:ABC-type glutathione transport system ATPase component
VPGGERKRRGSARRRAAAWADGTAAKLRRVTASAWAQALILTRGAQLDEPTAGLDPKQIIETRDLIRSLAGDHTIVLSTHILPEVAQTCQRVVIINKGRVVAVDTPDNLTSRLKGAATMYVQVDAPGADAGAALAAVRGVTRVASADQPRGPVGPDLPPPPSTGPLAFEVESEPDVDVRRDLARAVVTRGWVLELRPVRMSLRTYSFRHHRKFRMRRMRNVLYMEKEFASFRPSPIASDRPLFTAVWLVLPCDGLQCSRASR